MRRIHPILQTQATECGLVCLAMVLTALGKHTDLYELRKKFPVSLKGATLDRLIDFSTMCGLSARPLSLDMDELSALRLPAVLHWDMNHFVVLEKVRRGVVHIVDPAVGRRKLQLNEVARHFTGVALELAPAVSFKERKLRPKLNLGQLTGSVIGLRPAVVKIFILALLMEGFAITGPLVNQFMLDQVFTSADTNLLGVLILGAGLLLLVQTALSLWRSWIVMRLNQTMGLQWVSNIFAHMVRLPSSYFEQRHLGDITSRFGASAAIQRTLTTSVVESMLDGLMAIFALLMMLLYSPLLSFIVLAALGLYLLVQLSGYSVYREAAAERITISARESSHFMETVRAIVPLKLFGREEHRRSRWENLIVDVQNRDTQTAKMNILFSSAFALIAGIENLAVMYVGGNMVIGGFAGGASMMTVGMLFAFLAYKGQFTARLYSLINYGVQLKMLGLQSERLADIVLQEKEETETVQQSLDSLAHLSPSLELRNVSFRYGEGEPWVIKDINLKVEAGESIALTGPSGAGKSTLLKLMLGLESPTEGEILYGGIPIRQLGLSAFRREIGTVMQDDLLLTGSLYENVSFFDPLIDFQRVEHCCKIANVHEEILRMPMGYHTRTGDLGSGLSGGQRQRVLLARALYKKPRVLAMDEATSHLDLHNERVISEAIKQMLLTRLIIAHRPETIMGAQRVVRVAGQKVQEVLHEVALKSHFSQELSTVE